MTRYIHGVLSVSEYTPTGNAGEYTFTNALYNDQSDVAGNGTSVIEPGFILIVPATDPNSGGGIAGVAHRYKLTSLTCPDNFHISGTILWDEDGAEEDMPTNGSDAILSEPTLHYKFALPVSDSIYSGLAPGMTVAASVIDLDQKIDKVGTDWDVITNHPTTLTGYGITDQVILEGDARLTDARTPLAHTQHWNTITEKPTTLGGYGITDGVLSTDSRLTDARTPLAHTQDFSTITSTPTTLAGYGITDAQATLPTGTSTQYLRGDLTMQTLDTDAVSEGSANLYFTAARHDYTTLANVPASFAPSAHTHPWTDLTEVPTLTNTVNGLSGAVVLTTTNIAEGDKLYWTEARFNTSLAAKTTDDVAEGSSHLYFTAARHDYTTLLNVPTSFTPSAHTQDFSTITATPTTLAGYGITDAVNSSQLGASNGVATLDASGKLTSAQIPAALLGGMVYQGMWDASTNTPEIPAAATANKGYYFIVQAGGTTSIDGCADWQPTDWIVSDGDKWVKIDNTDKVSSINGKIGIVTLGTDDVAEGATNLYYTQARFNTAFSAKTTTDLTEGTQLYYTQDRFDSAFAAKSTDNLTEGSTHLYYTQARFDAALAAKSTDNLAEGSANLYFTAARHDYTTLANIPASFTPSAHSQAWSTITATPTTLAGYGVTDTLTNTVNGKSGAVTLTTSDINEGTNQYFTTARVLSTALAGLSTADTSNVTSSDTVLQAIGKFEGRLEASATAAAAPVTYFQATSRYRMVDTTGLEVWAHSSSKAYGNLSWSRTGTALTVNHASHGHSVGERVILRNTNVDYQSALITSVSTNSYVIACSDTGATSGSAAYYSMGFTYAHNSTSAGSVSTGTLSAPANENVQLMSLRVRIGANMRASANTYTVTLPQSSTNGAGDDSSMSTVYLPTFMVRQDADTLPTQSATIAVNPSSAGYNVFQLAALPTSAATGVHILLQF